VDGRTGRRERVGKRGMAGESIEGMRRKKRGYGNRRRRGFQAEEDEWWEEQRKGVVHKGRPQLIMSFYSFSACPFLSACGISTPLTAADFPHQALRYSMGRP